MTVEVITAITAKGRVDETRYIKRQDYWDLKSEEKDLTVMKPIR